jgi:hypothetical protein
MFTEIIHKILIILKLIKRSRENKIIKKHYFSKFKKLKMYVIKVNNKNYNQLRTEM